jgi:hypothetical protein
LKNVKYGFTGTNLAIFHKENKKIIGGCGLQPFDPKILKEVPKGCEFYLGERYYSITKDQYSIKKV